MAQLFDQDGNAYRTDNPLEISRLKSRGYTEQPPEKVQTFTDTQFHPEGQKVEDVLKYMDENPADAKRVVAEEKASKSPRKSITDHTTA